MAKTSRSGGVLGALFDKSRFSIAFPVQNVGRVVSIVLDETHPRFKELGEWNGLGTIEYTLVDQIIPPTQNYPTAKPYDPSIRNLPLINEVVFISLLPNTDTNTFTTSKTSYYTSIIGLWNHPHHNAYPENSFAPPPSQVKDYTQTEAGSVRRVTDQSTEIYLGQTFFERSDIHPLLPFEGDVIQEGRWGNSIRFGSTVMNEQNNWSTVGMDGDPIMILRNGQSPFSTDEGWIPVVENINEDLSSIYSTSTQKIPLNASSTSYVSYKSDPPINPKEYGDESQIILNSGRLIFNTTQDHILLSSRKSINLNAISSVNIDAPDTIIQSTNVYLGSKDATESVLLGDTTVLLLKTLVQNLQAFTQICSTLVGVPPGTPLAPLNVVASQLTTILSQLSTNLDSAKSKYVKTA